MRVPLTHIPEPFLMTLVNTSPSQGSFLLDELYAEILPEYLQGKKESASKILNLLWSINQNLVVRVSSELHNQGKLTLNQVIENSKCIKDSIMKFANSLDMKFSVRFGILAAKRDFLHFDQWVSDRIGSNKDEFVEALLDYIELNLFKKASNTRSQADKEKILDQCHLDQQRLSSIFENLEDFGAKPYIKARI